MFGCCKSLVYVVYAQVSIVGVASLTKQTIYFNLAFDKFFALNRWMMYVSPFSTQKILVVTLPKDADLFIQKSLVVSNTEYNLTTDIIKSRVDSNITVLL